MIHFYRHREGAWGHGHAKQTCHLHARDPRLPPLEIRSDFISVHTLVDAVTKISCSKQERRPPRPWVVVALEPLLRRTTTQPPEGCRHRPFW